MAGLNLEAYYRSRPDVLNYIRNEREIKGTGWRDWANEKYGKNESDVSKYSEDELARLHYQRFGRNEGTTEGEAYRNALAGLSDYERRTGELRGAEGVNEETRKQVLKENFEKQYTPSSFDMGEFESLLGKLESSKMKQQRQKSVEGRRDIAAGGLAGMMDNF